MTQQARDRSTEVLIVGAGPVGLLAALCAVRRGFAVEIIDENPRAESRGHASLLHASSLRLLEALDLASPILASAHRLDRLVVYVDGVRSAELALTTPVLAVPQSALEEALRAALGAEGIEVAHARQATTILERDGRVHVRVMHWELAPTHAGDPERIWQPVSSSDHQADFVIGADGRSSRVRSAIGIDSVEMGAPLSYAMFELPSKDDSCDMVLAFSEGLASAMIQLPDGRIRWGFQTDSRTTEKLYASDLSELLARRASWYPDRAERIEWGRVVRFERRIARRFGKSRAWLAGDAAHGTSPFGAQSMNAGLAEARSLVDRIAECTEAGGELADLERYGAENQREWQKLLGVNVRFDLLPGAPSWLPTLARKIVPALPASGDDLEALLRQLGLVLR